MSHFESSGFGRGHALVSSVLTDLSEDCLSRRRVPQRWQNRRNYGRARGELPKPLGGQVIDAVKVLCRGKISLPFNRTLLNGVALALQSLNWCESIR
jgi:hypothetical protein